jgi:hypothetical protein
VPVPLGLIVPFNVAVSEATEVAASVVTEGAKAFVVKVWSEPLVVPTLFVATSLKWYVVPNSSPLMSELTAIALVPEPALVVVVVDP